MGRQRTGFLVRRGKVWYAVWTVGRKRFMKTTGERDRRKAETELRRIMEPFAVGDEVTTLETVAAHIQGRKAELSQIEDERNPPLTVAAAWSAYLAAPGKPDSGPVTLAQYEGHYGAFAKWLKKAHPAAPALRDVVPAMAGEYAAHLSGERGLSANSFNKHVRFLELLFKVLAAPARLAVNPWQGIQRKRVVSDSRRELTIDELKRVCAGAAGEMRTLFAVGIYTGLRLGDATTLRWSEVDLARRIIRRVPSKIARRNPRPVVIPIHPALSAILAEQAAESRAEYVLPETAALYRKNAPELSNAIQEHFKRAKVRTVKEGTGPATVKDKDGKEKTVSTGKRAVVEVGFHSLRHTFVSLCRESNAPLAVVEAIVGHSNPAMTRHYTHVSELAATNAVACLPSVMGGPPAVALPPADPVTILTAKMRGMAKRLNGKTWQTVKRELEALAARA